MLPIDPETPIGRLVGWIRARKQSDHSLAGPPVASAPQGPRGEELGRGEDSGHPALWRRDRNGAAAYRAFHDRYYDLARAKRNWQIVTFLSLAVLFIVTVAFIRLASTSRITPYVVEVSELGIARAFGPADPIAVDDRMIIAAISQFIVNVRRVTYDASTQRELILEAYAFADRRAQAFLDDYFSKPENDPRNLGRRLRRTVHIEGILRMPATDSWRVRWVETDHQRTGGTVARSAWEAVLTVQLAPPRTTEAVRVNPLGIYVTDINWSIINKSATNPGEGELHE